MEDPEMNLFLKKQTIGCQLCVKSGQVGMLN